MSSFVLSVFPCFILIASLASAEPKIKQLFPVQKVLLGQALFWTIEIRHPLWESYALSVNPCVGAQITIMNHELTEEGGEVRSRYRLKIVPTSLVVSETPSVVISDAKGQSTVINGKALMVQSISGSSLEIRKPGPPQFIATPIKPENWKLLLYLLLACLVALEAWKRFQLSSPRQILLRGLKRAEQEIGQQYLPFSLIRLLRSELLWGFSAEALTPSQLMETAKVDPQLVRIADGLASLEFSRYSGNAGLSQQDIVRDSIQAALEITRRQSRFRRLV